ncbi:Flp family type IVb pilin [Methylobacterium iners]|uniref:Flp family type IVb pilin n=1 Tax=Methylobacterium iners TaxID=418707 RepID=A0ABQ4S2S9_9HYPH|nr:Flp family type IVb pilin [Methylobacterium iners]GJD96000.1 hypothetical protein OCOJLMKI_3218 [Methylobacterium iners]
MTTSALTGFLSSIARRAPLPRRFARDDSGATAIEYALIAGLIFLAAVGGINLYASSVQGVYNKIGTAVAGQ